MSPHILLEVKCLAVQGKLGYWRSEIAENHANQTILGFHSSAVIFVRVKVVGLQESLSALVSTHLGHAPLAHIETGFVWFQAECEAVWVDSRDPATAFFYVFSISLH